MSLRAIFVTVPFLTLVFLSFYIYQRMKDYDHRLRVSLLISVTILGAYIVFVTEILSLFHSINFPAVVAAWLVALSISILLEMLRTSAAAHSLTGQAFTGRTAGGREAANISKSDAFLVACSALIVVMVGVIALIAPPNHWDVLAYHMSRVMHWQQNLSVDHYPTHITRQLTMGPFAEYAVLHLQVLAGSDRFANIVQCAGYAGSAIGASLLAAQFGATRRGQILALILVVTLPIAILQASVAKNDCVLGFWYLTSFSFFLRFKRSERLFDALLTGAAIGLALLTKSTAYIFIFPLLIWLIVWAINKYRLYAWKMLLPVAFIVVLFNAPFWWRNDHLFGNPLGRQFDTPASVADPAFSRRRASPVLRYGNDEINAALFISNVLRNIAVHAITPFESVNASIHWTILKIHQLVAANPNDRRTTWHYSRFQLQKGISYSDETGNPLHLLAAAISTGYCLTQFRASSNRNLFQAALVLAGAFLFFCMLTRWHHTIARLHIPLFFLSAALTGGIFSLSSRAVRVTSIFTAMLIVFAIPWLIFNEIRPLTGPSNIFKTSRFEQYFVSRNIRAYESAVEYIASRQCSEIGFRFSWWNETEYQFWMMLKKNNPSGVRIRHVNVENESAKLSHIPSFRQFQPCAVLLIDYSRKLPDQLTFNGIEFKKEQAFVDGAARILLPSSPESPAPATK